MGYQRPIKETRPASLMLRISAREKQELKLAAIDANVTVSKFLRDAAVERIMEGFRAKFEEYENNKNK